jgi:hypothetical protein
MVPWIYTPWYSSSSENFIFNISQQTPAVNKFRDRNMKYSDFFSAPGGRCGAPEEYPSSSREFLPIAEVHEKDGKSRGQRNYLRTKSTNA